ncbi:pentapeptide repeat-containing protein [Desulfobacter sp. UBA2225]|uniref:pentapeptide repeat-containing protein n=1 Tax=Desulfobacter sp. UBA2225 TaxID=1961413 RepID=UPI00257E7B44|nr:pentapeptide repeat-containing protein [Desulfobacter sp. UBA2225]
MTTNDEIDLKFNQEHYNLLMKCSKKRDMTEWNDFVDNLEDEKIYLEYADLRNPDSRSSWFVGVNLKNAILKSVNFEDAILTSAQLTKSNLSNANLKGACIRSANLEKTTLVCANLKYADCMGANFKEANLSYADLERTHFMWTKLNNSNFYNSNLRGASFNQANLENAYLNEANLCDTVFREANLKSARFCMAGCNAFTKIIDCFFDKNTDFRGVSIDTIQWNPGYKQLVEYNNRKLNWFEWYSEHKMLQWPFRFFWNFSDYGHSSIRIITWFVCLSVLFGALYFCFPDMVEGLYNNNMPTGFVALRAFYFSIVTMTTLGFGDIYANSKGPWNWYNYCGHFLLILQVILGYFILGALVTRLSIIFSSDGPSADYEKNKSKLGWLERIRTFWYK